MPRRPKPIHPEAFARNASESLGIYGIGEVTPEVAAERAKQHAFAEAEWERMYGDAAMPALIEQYERDLAAWEAEQGGDQAAVDDAIAIEAEEEAAAERRPRRYRIVTVNANKSPPKRTIVAVLEAAPDGALSTVHASLAGASLLGELKIETEAQLRREFTQSSFIYWEEIL